jgi:hypothetical protein
MAGRPAVMCSSHTLISGEKKALACGMSVEILFVR